MGFDYDRIKAKREGGGDFWTAYSDLFTVLSVVFLMLYVVASLRSGTFSIQKHIEYQRLSKEADDLREQIRVYNALKDEQMAQATADEQKQYEMLMDKLSLLQDQAKDEKKQLMAKAQENERKAEALNQYQQMIRNIINVNMLAKRQIKQRDNLIAYKDVALQDREGKIQQLNQDVAQKEQAIQRNEAQISQINRNLEQAIARARLEQRSRKTSKKQMEERIARMRAESQRRISQLEGANQLTAQELNAAKSDLAQASQQLNETTQQLGDLKVKSEAEKGQLIAQLEATRQGYARQMADLQAAARAKLAAERAAFGRELGKHKLSAAQRAKKEAEFRARAAADAAKLKGELAALGDKMKGTEGQLAQAKANEGRLIASVGDLSEKLKRAQELAETRKRLAEQIRRNFTQAGVKAEIDEKTGEVTLAFGDDYFETGSSDLKPTMRAKLEKFIPEYSKSLFNDPETAKNIANVEIIGFASSTYQGKYVNPQSLNPKDRAAVDYNLKLSFNRANAIFQHIFDPNKLKYQHQKDLLPLVKVVGRGYLPDGKQGSDIPEGLSEEKFCQQYNCKRAQRVIIKFNLKD